MRRRTVKTKSPGESNESCERETRSILRSTALDAARKSPGQVLRARAGGGRVTARTTGSSISPPRKKGEFVTGREKRRKNEITAPFDWRRTISHEARRQSERVPRRRRRSRADNSKNVSGTAITGRQVRALRESESFSRARARRRQ